MQAHRGHSQLSATKVLEKILISLFVTLPLSFLSSRQPLWIPAISPCPSSPRFSHQYQRAVSHSLSRPLFLMTISNPPRQGWGAGLCTRSFYQRHPQFLQLPPLRDPSLLQLHESAPLLGVLVLTAQRA